MISNHLSLVEQLQPARYELAAQVEQYLAAGGEIEVAEPTGYKPKPITYSNQMPPAPKPFVRRRIEAAPLPCIPINERAAKRNKLIEKVAELAPTHTQSEVAQMLHVCRRTLCGMTKDFGIKFKRAVRGGNQDPDRQKLLEERDAQFAKRIRAFMELGITRRQCCGKLAISNKAFERIIAAHGIDYPKARQGKTSCAA
ncbi:hypothetical protein MJP36_17745 [Pseudomonas palleroniana]|uniref:hypothetical protein n=1 Tax=Pseudomonas palleroniana TaxID=191390 RepID=UPI001FCB18B4|nr:hypothetical protein [Pseudomonas palleroniana]UOK36350.1 hypothetical protein MJP36_17745 [Pseudomonas palleroniana]